MNDLTSHLPQDDRWVLGYAASLGWEELCRYYDRVFLRLLRMQSGEEMHILREVSPGNYDLFLKCACTAIRELHALGLCSWHVEQRGTLILRS